MRGLAFGVVGVLAVVGCKEKVDSQDIRTHGVYASFSAVANGSGTTVSAQLKVGGSNSNTYLELTGQDKLTATVGTEKGNLVGSNQTYRATFTTEEGGTSVKIAFLRGSADEDAPNSVATLPEPFTLEGIDTNQEVSRQEDIVISWDPVANDDLEWDLDGDCISLEFGNEMDDPGMLVLTAGSVEPRFSDDADKTCEVTFTLDRIRKGTVDANFGEGGKFEAIQRRRLKFLSTP